MECKKPMWLPKQGAHVPCGKCIPCLANRREEWTSRIIMEAQNHRESCFLTLTYNNENLPPDRCLRREEMQAFFKRFRKAIHPRKVRYFYCGEYGTKDGRPHYHAIVFNWPSCLFIGRRDVQSRGVDCLCPSCLPIVNAWGKGHIRNLEMNAQRARYTAKYCMKDQVVVDNTAGRTPQFAGMSLKPPLGSGHVKIIGMQIRDFMHHKYDVPSHVSLDDKMRPLGRTMRKKLRGTLDRDESTSPLVLKAAAEKVQALRQTAKDQGTSVRSVVEEKTHGKVHRAEIKLERARNRETQ